MAAKQLRVVILLVTITAIKMAEYNAGLQNKTLKSLLRKVPQFPKRVYSTPEWIKILKNLKPKADNPYAAKIWQPSSAGKVKNVASGMIIGGQGSLRGQFPWQAAISIDRTWLCGGSLILDNFVLTAAHCVFQRKSFKIILGSINLYTSGGTVLTTTQKYVHPYYNRTSLENDIALLKLLTRVNVNSTSTIGLAKLPPISAATTTFNRVAARASGFGQTSEDPYDLFAGTSPYLMYADLTVISNAECASYFGTMYVTADTICTKQSNEAPCHGDSGGALVYFNPTSNSWVQIGIVSYVAGEGCQLGPTGFTRVTSYLGWISSITDNIFDIAD